MKKLIATIPLLILTFFLTSCINISDLHQDKIIAPKPDMLDIEGDWKITDYNILNTEEAKDFNYEKYLNSQVAISDNLVKINENKVLNPKFKFKRVDANYYINYGNKTVDSNSILNDLEGYLNIISVSDNDKNYFDFINKGKNNSYIYMNGYLFKLEKIRDTPSVTETETLENAQTEKYKIAETLSQESDYYKMDTGVLLGLKTPSTIDSNGIFQDATYRTLWIPFYDNELGDVIEINNLLVPRMNGFSEITLTSNVMNIDDREEKLSMKTVDGKNKDEIKEKDGAKSISKGFNVYREITFVSGNYIGLEYDQGKTFQNFNRYEILALDSLNSADSIDIVSLFGVEGKNGYDSSKKKVINLLKDDELEEYNVDIDDYRNITLARKNGQWEIKSNIASKKGDKMIDFILPISPNKVLLNFDEQIVQWNKAKEINPAMVDLISSPNGRISIVQSKDNLSIYEIKKGKIDTKSIKDIKINENETIVMAEWATGEFVKSWEQVVKKN